jgi:hypothetical protein
MNTAELVLATIDRPDQAMEGVAQRPRIWWVMAALLAISLVVLTALSVDLAVELANERSEAMIERMRQAQSLSEEQMQMVRERGQTMTAPRYWLTTLGIGLPLAALGWVIRGAVIHFSSMAMGGASAWPATFAITVWAQLPFAVRNLLQAGYVRWSGALIEHRGISFLVAESDWLVNSRSLAYGVLAQIDPFVLWHLALLTIGIAVAARLTRGQAAVLAIVVWALFLGLSLAPTLIGRAFMPV